MTHQTAALLGLAGLVLVGAALFAAGRRLAWPLPDPHDQLFSFAASAMLSAAFGGVAFYVGAACVEVLADPAAVPEARDQLANGVWMLVVVLFACVLAFPVVWLIRYVDDADQQAYQERRATARRNRQRGEG